MCLVRRHLKGHLKGAIPWLVRGRRAQLHTLELLGRPVGGRAAAHFFFLIGVRARLPQLLREVLWPAAKVLFQLHPFSSVDVHGRPALELTQSAAASARVGEPAWSRPQVFRPSALLLWRPSLLTMKARSMIANVNSGMMQDGPEWIWAELLQHSLICNARAYSLRIAATRTLFPIREHRRSESSNNVHARLKVETAVIPCYRNLRRCADERF